MPLFKSTQDAVNRVTPIEMHIDGATINSGLSSDVYAPVHNGNAVLFCKAVSLRSDGTAGFLAVHLTGDPVGTWYLVDLIPGQSPIGIEFDLVGNNVKGTTVTLDAKLNIYPALYSQVSNF